MKLLEENMLLEHLTSLHTMTQQFLIISIMKKIHINLVL